MYWINAGVYQYTNWTVLVYGFAVMFGILVLLGSVSLIYSAFTISVSERDEAVRPSFLLLSYEKQIRKSVMAESAVYSSCGNSHRYSDRNRRNGCNAAFYRRQIYQSH